LDLPRVRLDSRVRRSLASTCLFLGRHQGQPLRPRGTHTQKIENNPMQRSSAGRHAPRAVFAPG